MEQVSENPDFENYAYPTQSGMLVTNLEEESKYALTAEPTCETPRLGSPSICAYDESVNKFLCLEGSAYVTSHSLVLLGKNDYLSRNYLTLNFYTRSKSLTDQWKHLKQVTDPEVQYKLDYVRDRSELLLNNTPDHTILLIDGPLIGGQISSHTVRLNNELLKKDIVPVFAVKNSMSNLVTANSPELRDRYNSDLHWAYKVLNPGERTSLFKYMERGNPRNAKVFCYVKPFNVSPQRIEFHLDTFDKYDHAKDDLMNLIYYLLLAQGNPKNPQIRPIAIAEAYARATLKLIDLNQLLRRFGLVPTINQERFGEV